MRVEGYHKSYGRVMMDADDLATDHPMIKVTLINKRDQFAHCGNALTVSKAALKDTGGYKPKHRDKPLAELYLPLAMKTAARMRKGEDEYEELVGIASEALVKAANKNKDNHVVNFAVFARIAVENAIKNHWASEATKIRGGTDTFVAELENDWFKPSLSYSEQELMVRVDAALVDLRPRLRQLVQRMYLSDNPVLAKELAYEWNVSVVRITQLKQEAMGLLRDALKNN